jgi:hypothetical protein
MKKWLWGLLVLFVLLLTSVFIFIPGNLKVSTICIVKSSIPGAYRVVSEERNWERWTQDNGTVKDSINHYMGCNKYRFRLSVKLYNAVIIKASHGNEEIDTKLVLFQLTPDSITLHWETSTVGSLNPIKRLMQYMDAVERKHCFSQLLDNLKNFLEAPLNVYGYDITRTTLKDSVLVSIKSTANHYPTVTEVYKLIGKLRTYISAQGAVATNFPMLHIIRNKDSTFETRVAIATNKALEGNKEILLKRLAIIPDKILTTEVKGGDRSIMNGFNAIEKYMVDYNLTPPVIPFQLLLTDRSQQSDTAKWLTRIYYPII